MNFDVITCSNTLFNLEGLIKNAGSYILFGNIFIHSIFGILFYLKGYAKLISEILEIMKFKDIKNHYRENKENNNLIKDNSFKENVNNNNVRKNTKTGNVSNDLNEKIIKIESLEISNPPKKKKLEKKIR